VAGACSGAGRHAVKRPAEAWVTPTAGVPYEQFAGLAFVVWLGLAVGFGSWVLGGLAVVALVVARGRGWWAVVYWARRRVVRRRRGRRRGVVTETPAGVPVFSAPEFDPDEPTLNI
jgi:hypothetical protein